MRSMNGDMILDAGLNIMKRHQQSKNQRCGNSTILFKRLYGVSHTIAARVWDMISRTGALRLMGFNPTIVHLLYGLFFLACYPKEDIAAVMFGCTRKTYRVWLWRIVYAIAGLKPQVVRHPRYIEIHS